MDKKKLLITTLSFALVILLINCSTKQPAKLTDDSLTKIEKKLQELESKDLFSGVVLISQNDSIVFQKAYGYSDLNKEIPNTLKTQFYIGSITKQFTAYLVVTYCLKNNIPFSKKIDDILPDFKDSKITIHHLLSHSSGIPHYEGLESVLPIHDNKSRQKLFANKKHSIEDYTKLISKMKRRFLPGKRYKYSSFNYILLGAILEKISGKKYRELLQEHVVVPLQLSNTDFDYKKQELFNFATGKKVVNNKLEQAPFQDQSVLFSTGGIHSNISDLYKWVQAFYHKKHLTNDEEEVIFSNHSEIGFRHFYGYGVMMRDGYGRLLSKIGFNRFNYLEHGGQLPGYRSAIVSIEDNLDIIILSNIGNATHPREIKTYIDMFI